MELIKLKTDAFMEIVKKHQIDEFAAKVLASKELTNAQIAEILNAPKLNAVSSCVAIAKVVKRITNAKERHEKIMVCGDYDADGICATAILVDALRKYGCEVGFYIPNRISEGYGIKGSHIAAGVAKGYSLFITVDNGVGSLEAMAEAHKLNVDLIISDHHNYEDQNIDCFAFLHPLLMEPHFHFLSGAGVAFELSRALLKTEKSLHLVLACVACIGDVMELKGENRQIVLLGLKLLQEQACSCVQLLKDTDDGWNESTIAFQVVPKLNATGRLSDVVHTYDTVKYLLSNDIKTLQTMAKRIKQVNNLRKEKCKEMEIVASDLLKDISQFPILYHPKFHEGLIGILAGSISSKYQKPCMALSYRDGIYKGSIRSVPSVNLTGFFDDCKAELLSYGGHAYAAGIAFEECQRENVEKYIAEKIKKIIINKSITYKCIEINQNDLTKANIDAMNTLRPFGNGFSSPLFYIDKCKVSKFVWLANHRHLKIIVDEHCEIIYFNCKLNDDEIAGKNSFKVIGSLQKQTFRGITKVQIVASEVF